ncbi:MAG: Activator of Hsp90 ATPase 1 family protein [Candidatus Nomurabacteria bacterium]|nr:Activator of Hsp90 ATPase 1 family protein [Candidatus Nomurabacteria bacterium]
MENIKELSIERIYDASLESVWKAWTDPEMLKKWWGPNNVTIPLCEVDLRRGGKFYIVMEAGVGMGPYKGLKWPMLAEFTEVVPNSRLSYNANAWTEGKKEETMIDQMTEITFSEEDGKTKVSIKAVIYKTGPEAQMAVQGMEAGFTQQLGKLNSFLTAAN